MSGFSIGTVVGAVVITALAFGYPAQAQDKKAKSKCNAISEETACKADATCLWVPAATNSKTGKERKAYCKTKSIPKKKAPKKDATTK